MKKKTGTHAQVLRRSFVTQPTNLQNWTTKIEQAGYCICTSKSPHFLTLDLVQFLHFALCPAGKDTQVLEISWPLCFFFFFFFFFFFCWILPACTRAIESFELHCCHVRCCTYIFFFFFSFLFFFLPFLFSSRPFTQYLFFALCHSVFFIFDLSFSFLFLFLLFLFCCSNTRWWSAGERSIWTTRTRLWRAWRPSGPTPVLVLAARSSRTKPSAAWPATCRRCRSSRTTPRSLVSDSPTRYPLRAGRRGAKQSQKVSPGGGAGMEYSRCLCSKKEVNARRRRRRERRKRRMARGQWFALLLLLFLLLLLLLLLVLLWVCGIHLRATPILAFAAVFSIQE